jgi:hypothetical protein
MARRRTGPKDVFVRRCAYWHRGRRGQITPIATFLTAALVAVGVNLTIGSTASATDLPPVYAKAPVVAPHLGCPASRPCRTILFRSTYK